MTDFGDLQSDSKREAFSEIIPDSKQMLKLNKEENKNELRMRIKND